VSALDDLIDDVPWDPPGSPVQAAREELVALRGLLAEANASLSEAHSALWQSDCAPEPLLIAIDDLIERLDAALPKATTDE